MRYSRVTLPLLFALFGFAEQADQGGGDGTRQLYYLGSQPGTGASATAAPKLSAAMHLGLRYNVVLVHGKNNVEQISTNRVLREGDCFAIDLQTNHSGFLYVLARQSSGSWMPLFPSPDMDSERNQIEAMKEVRVPRGYCFSIHKPAGKETLFVVFSRERKDFYELYESVKAKQQDKIGGNKSSELAEAKQVDAAVEHLNEKFGGSRDLSITKVPEPKGEGEPRGAVYVVNNSDKPSTLLVTRVEVIHR